MNDQALLRRAQAVAPWAVDMRRQLHRVPEIANREFKTQALMVRALDELGIEHREAGTGVLGLIRGAASGPAIALRADIDALPVTEPAGPFRSQHEGMMHACGHDAHTAIALGAGRLLHEAREHLAGDVRLIFQPAEEGPCGAADMIAAGALSDPPVSAVYGLHVMPHLPFGAIETRAGALNAACDTLTLRIVGRSGHGAYPERNADAIVCAAQVISAMQTLVS
ncbi:MAG: amidohydrolase, partial [Clostridiales bacterium]|nr:amidohydrolase [Clostridiales bacterium]